MLRQLGIHFTQYHSRVDETLDVPLSVNRLAVELALRKAEACGSTDALVIAMDTIVVQGRLRLGKPIDRFDAQRMLKALSGKMHRVVTGVALRFRDKTVNEFEVTRVYFRKITAEEIKWYVTSGEPFDKAGAYAIQGSGRIFIEKIDGCYFNVIGFPIGAFQRALKKLNLTIFDLMEAPPKLA